MANDFDIDILSVTLTATDDGEPVLNAGDTTDGAGVGAGLSSYGVVGLSSRPNAPSPNGDSVRLLVLTMGDDRLVFGTRDDRWLPKLHTVRPGSVPGNGDLGEGDVALLSNCEARLELRRSANTIGLYSSDTEVVVDGANGTVIAKKGSNSAEIGSTSVRLKVGTMAEVTATTTAITLRVGVANLVLNSTGVAIFSTFPVPLTLTLNGVPVS